MTCKCFSLTEKCEIHVAATETIYGLLDGEEVLVKIDFGKTKMSEAEAWKILNGGESLN